MANYNIDAKKNMTYDAIVIGSGISGGWAAKELCEGGLKTLVLERGRIVEHVKDYPTMNNDPWDLDLRGALGPEDLKKHKIGARRVLSGPTMSISMPMMRKTPIPKSSLSSGFGATKWEVDHFFGETVLPMERHRF